MSFYSFPARINVGGHIAKKETLQNAFTSLGFQNVTTFKQSGNVIFESKDTNLQEIKTRIEGCLKAALGFEVPVFFALQSNFKKSSLTTPSTTKAAKTQVF